MPRLSQDVWETVRAEREAGATMSALAEAFNVDKAAISRRAKAEGWGDGTDVAEAVKRKINEKINGISTGDLAKKKAEAIDAAADRAAEVIRRHQEESNAIRERLYSGLKAHKAAIIKEDKALAFEDLKAAKIASECMINIHRIERQAWGMDEAKEQTGSTIVIERGYGRK